MGPIPPIRKAVEAEQVNRWKEQANQIATDIKALVYELYDHSGPTRDELIKLPVVRVDAIVEFTEAVDSRLVLRSIARRFDDVFTDLLHFLNGAVPFIDTGYSEERPERLLLMPHNPMGPVSVPEEPKPPTDDAKPVEQTKEDSTSDVRPDDGSRESGTQAV